MKEAEPTRRNPGDVFGYELYRINCAPYGKGACTFIRDVRDKHEKIFVGNSYMFDGDILQLSNINYELKYWDDILILLGIDTKDGYCTEGYYKATNDLCVLVNRPYVEFQISRTFAEGLKCYGLHLRNGSNDGGLKRNHAHYKLKRMICNENAINFMEGCITTIWVEFDSVYNYEMVVFFLNLLNINLESKWVFIRNDDDKLFDISERLYIWS